MLSVRARRRQETHRETGFSLPRRVLAVFASALVVASVLTPVAANAALGDPGGLTVQKLADGLTATTIAPGDSFNYSIAVGCDDNPCIDAVLADELPDEFAGFVLGQISVFPSSLAHNLSLTGGCAEDAPLVAGCAIGVSFLEALGDIGGVPQVGINAGVTARISYELTAPAGLSPLWAHNGTAVPNLAEVTAANATTVQSTANVTVDIPVVVDVEVVKSWTPSSAQYGPGTASTISTTIRNTSNVLATSLVVQDPATVTAPAAALDASSPFQVVDFAGFCAAGAVTFPAGADLVQIDALYSPADGEDWAWVNGAPDAAAQLPASVTDLSRVGGIRATYTSSTGATIVANGAAGSLCFDVTQRATHRTSGDSLVLGTSATNIAAGTVTVPNEDPVTETSQATMTVTGLNVVVTAGKEIAPARIPAGGKANVTVGARNDSNGTLSTLTIAEPSTGVEFLSNELVFDGFTDATWPTGATSATLTWSFSDSTTHSVAFDATGAPGLPVIPAGAHITGFTATYTGAIIPGTAAGLEFDVSADPAMIPSTSVFETFQNSVTATGTNAAGTDTDTTTAPLHVYFPDIDIALIKSLSPTTLVTPGGTVVATLTATTSSLSQYVTPTEVVVTDRLLPRTTGAPDFWESHRIRSILFTDVPAGSTLKVEYTITYPASATPVWQTHEAAVPEGLYSADLVALLGQSVADSITGIRFTFTDPLGVGQGTSVQPNLVFEAAGTLRDGTTPVDLPETPPATQVGTLYENTGTAQGSGVAGTVAVVSDVVEDDDDIRVIVYPSDGDGTGSLLAEKDWRQANGNANPSPALSQSGQTLRTLQRWGVTTPGYATVVLTDASDPEAGPAGTVFQAFNLTRILPVSFTQDPLLRWDVVQSVELYDGTAWQTVPAPSGSWMSGTGFKGYDLTADQQASTTGLRITVAENTAARTASTDPTRPAAGSGVASAAEARQIYFQWSLRNALRVPGPGDDLWVDADRGYNVPGTGACAPLECGIVRNTLGVTANPLTGSPITRTVSDDIGLVDTLPNVNARKTVAPTFITVPHPGDVNPADYPTVTYTVEAWNTASARASYLRSADPMPCATAAPDCLTSGTNPTPDIFTGHAYDAANNPFERFTITDINVVIPGGTSIDTTASRAALWKRAADGTMSVDTTMSIAQVAALPAGALTEVVGISVVYQSTSPETTGGLIPMQADNAGHPRLVITAQLRDGLRSTPATHPNGGVTVDNDTIAQSFDPVLTPTGAGSTPYRVTEAGLQLRAAHLDVTASKGISPDTIVEPNPYVPLTVSLGATDGTATLAAEVVTISDVDADFWATFELTGLVSTTRPAGAALVRAEVRLSGDPAWIAGPAGATAALPAVDLAQVDGIRFIFYNADGSPFSRTVPSADWSAQAVFTVVHRSTVPFVAESINNEVSVTAWHDGYPEVAQADADIVLLSPGISRMTVQKEALTGNATHVTEPGTPIDWTLRFTNTGTSYLDVVSVVDDLGTHLAWDGGTPTYSTSAGGTLPTTGIVVTQPTASTIQFTWPGAARMQPGESFLVTLKIELLPGLTLNERATNEFVVTTQQTLVSCTNTSGNGQGVLAGLAATECGTSSFVRPLGGALLFAQKSVQGEVDGTLTSGATNVVDPSQTCTPDAQGFYRTVCAAHTVIGATDTWRLRVVNSGTTPYRSITAVDVLPRPGDRMLATGSARGSEFRPVLVDVAAPGSVVLPAGSVQTWEVTTDPLACIGSGATPTWGADPQCSASTWVLGSAYAGAPEDITAVRWQVDFTGTTAGALLPGGEAELRFNTRNTPGVSAQSPSVEAPVQEQHAWNQFGVAAMTNGADVIRRAPTKTGVVTQVTGFEVEKLVDGAAAAFAPADFEVAPECTIAGVPVNMAALATVVVPANGFATLGGLPLGAECEIVSETRTGGAHDIDLGAPVLLDGADPLPRIIVSNTFRGGPLAIVKQRVGQGADLFGAGPFVVEVSCTWLTDGTVQSLQLPDNGEFSLSAANGYRAEIPVLPVGAECEIEETDAAGATSTRMDPVDGIVEIVEAAPLVQTATVTITNSFDWIPVTGQNLRGTVVWSLLGVLLVLLGAIAVLWTTRRRILRDGAN